MTFKKKVNISNKIARKARTRTEKIRKFGLKNRDFAQKNNPSAH